MPHEETITPALTPEEWAQYEGMYYHDIWTDLIHNPRDRSAPHRWDAPKLHAAAALALNGQPFGFTHGDVRALRAFDFQFWGNDEDSVLVRRADCEALHRLASRIAALLPPEDATP